MNEIGSREYGCFPNNTTGYRKLCNWVKTNAWNTIAEEWLFCGEDTGSCSIGLSKWLYGKGYDIWIENAYAIKHSSGIQRVKTIRRTQQSLLNTHGGNRTRLYPLNH